MPRTSTAYLGFDVPFHPSAYLARVSDSSLGQDASDDLKNEGHEHDKYRECSITAQGMNKDVYGPLFHGQHIRDNVLLDQVDDMGELS